MSTMCAPAGGALLGAVRGVANRGLQLAQHVTGQPPRCDVDLDVELRELRLEVRVGDPLERTGVDHRRDAVLVGEVELHLEADGRAVAVEAGFGQHPRERVEATWTFSRYRCRSSRLNSVAAISSPTVEPFPLRAQAEPDTRYEPDRGVPFWGYASWLVRQAMQQLVGSRARDPQSPLRPRRRGGRYARSPPGWGSTPNASANSSAARSASWHGRRVDGVRAERPAH